MKIQTSLEFLLLLSVVAMLGFSTLVFYEKGMGLNKESLSAFELQAPNPNSVNLTVAPDPQILIYFPLNSTLLSENEFQIDAYGCTSGRDDVKFLSNTTEFSQDNISFASDNITMVNGQFEPLISGPDKIKVEYGLVCSGINKTSSEIFETYALKNGQEGGQEGNQISGYILRRNESLNYSGSSDQVTDLEESSHCTMTNVRTGSIFSFPVQCGTTNAWDYVIFDDNCLEPYYSYSSTFCIVPISTGYNISSFDQYDYIATYNISLIMYTPAGILESNLSDKKPDGEIFLNGIDVGNADVISVYAGAYQPGIEIMRNQSVYWNVNNTVYEDYVQAENNLHSTLSFYNLSGVSTSTQDSIQEAISAFESASSSIVASKMNSADGACRISNDNYVCPAVSPFEYTIDANISDSLGLPNTTLPYQGSEIVLSER
jgi:hypothetical protein